MSRAQDATSGWDLRYRADHEPCPTRNGGELYYEVAGSGEPLVCINNFFTIAPAWRNFTHTLAQEFRVITYDLQNQGVSSQPGTLSFDEHGEDLIDLLDRLEIPSACLIGTSISTLICRDVSLVHPERVAGTVMMGPAFSPSGDFRIRLLIKDWLARLEHGGATHLFNYLYPLVFSDRMIEAGGRAGYLGLRERFLSLNSTEQIRICLRGALEAGQDPGLLEQVTAPTLLMIGDGDYLWGRNTLENAVERFANAYGVVVDDTGHLPFMERPDEFQRLVAAFVRDMCFTSA